MSIAVDATIPRGTGALFLRAYLFTAAGCLVPFVLSGALLLQSSELAPVQGIARAQQAQHAVYASATWQNVFVYKQALVAVRRPEILVLGSSRSLHYREEFFTRPFVNAGVAMTSLAQGTRFIAAMPVVPRVALILIDPWWFNSAWPGAYDERDLPQDGDVLTADKLVLPFHWLKDGKLSPEDVTALLAGRTRANVMTRFPKLGVKAMQTDAGFRRDGSFEYASLYFGGRIVDDAPDVGFQRTLSQVSTNTAYFVAAAEPDRGRVRELAALLDTARGRGISLVLLLSPFAPPVGARLAASRAQAGFLRQVTTAIRQTISGLSGVELFDWTDEAATGRHDCEFVDGIHEGDVMAQRALLAIAAARHPSAINGYIDVAALTRQVAAFSGRTLSVFDPAQYAREETDFLRLGCDKRTGRP